MAASRLTASALVHPVHSEHDLAGPNSPYKTGTWERYVTSLEAHQHIHAYGNPWNNEEDLLAMVRDLKSDKYTALILDSPALEYVTAPGQNPDCDLHLVGEPFKSFSLALAFPVAFDDAVVYAFSQNIVRLQTFQGALDMLESVYIKTGGTQQCYSSDAGGHGSGEAIELFQVSGLWYILLITVGVCFLLTAAHNLRKQPNKAAKFKRLARALSTWSTAGSPDAADGAHGSDAGAPTAV